MSGSLKPSAASAHVSQTGFAARRGLRGAAPGMVPGPAAPRGAILATSPDAAPVIEKGLVAASAEIRMSTQEATQVATDAAGSELWWTLAVVYQTTRGGPGAIRDQTSALGGSRLPAR
jgi:hypothetical protein